MSVLEVMEGGFTVAGFVNLIPRSTEHVCESHALNGRIIAQKQPPRSHRPVICGRSRLHAQIMPMENRFPQPAMYAIVTKCYRDVDNIQVVLADEA